MEPILALFMKLYETECVSFMENVWYCVACRLEWYRVGIQTQTGLQ